MSKKENKVGVLIRIAILLVVIRFSFRPLAFLPVLENIYIFYSLGAALIIIASPRFFLTKYFICALSYTIVMLLNFGMQDNLNIGNILSEGFTILFISSLAYLLFFSNKDTGNLSSWLIYSFFIITVVYTVASFIIDRQYPGVMRMAAMEANYETSIPFFKMGLSSYFFPHAIACLIPAYVLGLKSKLSPAKKWISLILLLLSLVLTYITQATGAMILAAVAFLLAVIMKRTFKKNNYRVVIIVALLFSPIIVSESIQLSILETAANLVGEDSQYLPKIVELASVIKDDAGAGAGGDIQKRGNLLQSTLDAIIRNPVFGVDDRSYGNHNALLDRWAEYGLVGFIPLIILIVSLIKNSRKLFPQDVKEFYTLGAVISVIMMLFKSMFGWDQWFVTFVMLPLLVRYFGEENKEYR